MTEVQTQTRPRSDSAERLDDVLDLLGGWLWEMDAGLRFSYFSESLTTHTGVAIETVLGRTRSEIGTIDLSSAEWQAHEAQLEQREIFTPLDVKRYEDGRWLWMRTAGKPRFAPDGTFLGYRGIGYDITEQKEAQVALAKTRRFLDRILEHVPVAIAVRDAVTRRYVFVNKAYENLMEVDRNAVLGRTLRDIYDAEHAAILAELDDRAFRSNKVVVHEDQGFSTPWKGRHVSRTTRLVVRDEGGAPELIIIVIEDQTEERAAQQRIAHMALHDALTGLLNRAAFMEKLAEARARQERSLGDYAVLLIDLDYFKQVNDTLGHAAGDELLVEVAHRLRQSIRGIDVAARLGGDEFGIIQAGTELAEGDVGQLAERILAVLSTPFKICGKDVRIGASIGIAIAGQNEADTSELLALADMALYQAKDEGRNAFRLYVPRMGEVAKDRRALEKELRGAVANGELVLHFQPIVDATAKTTVCLEALLRWNHPSRGLVAPDNFIPVAEECGLINEITRWCLDHACRAARRWPDHIGVAVNISSTEFNSAGIVDRVRSALEASGLSPRRLELEVTETSLVDDPEACVARLADLKRLGVSIALDDFGTGYSSLSHLVKFQVDKIKIDRSFVSRIHDRRDCAAVVSAVLALAKALNVTTTAEGVETEEQRRWLTRAGADTLQGFLFARPMRVEAIDFDAPEHSRSFAGKRRTPSASQSDAIDWLGVTS
jgi:diguanylate cyclase (GGDEF)-like protein/PAS domain S-box-containing protein